MHTVMYTLSNCPLFTASISAFCILLGSDAASVSPVELGERIGGEAAQSIDWVTTDWL